MTGPTPGMTGFMAGKTPGTRGSCSGYAAPAWLFAVCFGVSQGRQKGETGTPAGMAAMAGWAGWAAGATATMTGAG